VNNNDNLIELDSVRINRPSASDHLIEDMKVIKAAIQRAEAQAPGTKVNEIVNDLVEFMMLLTANDRVDFAASIRQIMDKVIEVRKNYTDERVESRKIPVENMTSHQRLVLEMQKTQEIVMGFSFENDLHQILEQCGYTLRNYTPRVEETPADVDSDIVSGPSEDEVLNLSTLNKRISDMEILISDEMQAIRTLLERK
jgi:cell fate (sporulation/competence/biofilm development) regulator YlbF (YheA/YmcA/DUF963 family)